MSAPAIVHVYRGLAWLGCYPARSLDAAAVILALAHRPKGGARTHYQIAWFDEKQYAHYLWRGTL